MPRKLYEWRDHLSEREAKQLARLETRKETARAALSVVLDAIQLIRAKAVQRARFHAKKQEKTQ